MKDLIAILIGSLFGFFSGFTGYSSVGILLAGLSIFSLVKDYQTIVGTSLYAIMFPFSVFAVLHHYKHNTINFHIGNILVISMIIGVGVGTAATNLMSIEKYEKMSRCFAGILSLIVGAYFLYTANAC